MAREILIAAMHVARAAEDELRNSHDRRTHVSASKRVTRRDVRGA